MAPDATIFALASAPGRAGVSVLRISGRAAARAFGLCAPHTVPPPRLAQLRALRRPGDGGLIDKALVLWFPAPHSFTGEDVAEFHLHGSRAVLQAVTECLGALPGFRIAEPGEFTRRAFMNGKLDLTEVEALADLIDAETEAQRRQAIRQLDGELGRLYESWRGRLARVLAHLEAAIDFADEDLPPDMESRQANDIVALAAEIAAHLDDRQCGERLREGFSVAILGPPNAGKSSLLNALARRDAAIVSSDAGTTRDVIEVHMDLAGYPVILADTAGLRDSADAVENEGMRRALARAANADLKLLVYDGALWPELDGPTKMLADAQALAVVNKADLCPAAGTGGELFISAITGAGIPVLLDRIAARIAERFLTPTAPPLTRARHRAALEESLGHLGAARDPKEAALRAEDIRLAMRALGRITGRVDVEDLLDIIFRDFCIGK
ncbi:MAG: tRNA uridine-5-carboxymethylaminomethyl(34) synthesis GTPase MnmE [Bdellovibrionales bacterium]